MNGCDVFEQVGIYVSRREHFVEATETITISSHTLVHRIAKNTIRKEIKCYSS